MARPLRIERPGAWYHVTARGNERRPIYRDDRDRRHFCEVLAEAVDRFHLALHAYVLMDNHFHLLLETAEPNLSRAMQWLSVSYSVWFNRRHGRVGHLFQGRFKAILVDPVGWGLALSRYVHLNPVRVGRWGLDKAARQEQRVGMGEVPTPRVVQERIRALRGFRWSSYRAYVGLAQAPAWLRCEKVLQTVGGRQGLAQRQAYRNYVESAVRQGLPENPWARLTAQIVLGGTEFVHEACGGLRGNVREQTALRLLQHRRTLPEVIAAVEKLKGEPWAAFRDRHGDWGRDLALYLARTVCTSKLRTLAEAAGGIRYGSAGAAVKRFASRLKSDPALTAILAQARKVLEISNVEM
jgi:putative transposase